MIQRKIQTQAYWQGYTVTDEDVEELSLLLMEVERPMTAVEMGRLLVDSRCRREENIVRRQLQRGTLYRPNGAFQVGETLVFPHLDLALGKVVDQRRGHNPEHGEFSVITVELEERGDGPSRPVAAASGRTRGLRCFAAELQTPHKLALPDDWTLEEGLCSAEDLYARYGDWVVARLGERLRADELHPADVLHPADELHLPGPQFLSFRGTWLPASLAVEVHIGHVNIAEAMIDIRGQALTPEQVLSELGLPAEVPQPIKVFCLNRALAQDERFHDVGDASGPAWSLSRWAPAEVLSLPLRLRYQPVAYDRTKLDVTHLQLEREIDDEASALLAPPTAADARSVTILLGYPHWREGSLPLTDRTRALFPRGAPDQQTLITWHNRAEGEPTFPGWVVHGGRYVCGLEEWYRANNVLPGAFVKLERVEDRPAGVARASVGIDLLPRRMQREWVYVAFGTGRDGSSERQTSPGATPAGGLEFRLQKRPISFEYDELSVLDEHKRKEMDELWALEAERQRPFDELVRRVFVDLVKLSANGMVHSKTVYSAVNVVRRCPPGLVFATLFRLPEFVTAGDGYWIYQGGDDLL